MGTKAGSGASEIEELALETLRDGVGCLSGNLAGGFCEAASICLEQHHQGSAKLAVEGAFDELFLLTWQQTTPNLRRSWADLQLATEHGAYGIAILLIIRLTEFTVVERACKGTGIDFWLGIKSDSYADVLFQNKARMEVSGILQGTRTELSARTRQKLEQTKQSDGTQLPAFAIVTEFSEPRTRMAKR